MTLPKKTSRQPISEPHAIPLSLLSGVARVTVDHLRDLIDTEGGNAEDMIVMTELIMTFVMVGFEPLSEAHGADESRVLHVMADNCVKLLALVAEKQASLGADYAAMFQQPRAQGGKK
jgi:hypothetical protein